jgi:predicted RNase H-like HicB family nuclease
MSQGKTIEQALKNVREAILLYLETTPRKKRLAARPALVTTVEV